MADFRFYKEKVDEHLKTFLPSMPSYGGVVVDAMAYSLLAGGKRFRPVLLLGALQAVGAKIEEHPEAMEIACALECIHTYSLIHDDLPGMDDDDLRRGMPTNHKKYGEGIAILAGDGLQSYAFQKISDVMLGKELYQTGMMITNILACQSGMEGMVIGQTADLQAENRTIDLDELKWIHRHKTGALIEAAAHIGALLGNAEENHILHIRTYAQHIGLAFQITDDVLDVIGDTEKLGKATGMDAIRQKSTYVSILGLEESQRLAKQHITAAKKELTNLPGDITLLEEIADMLIKRQS